VSKPSEACASTSALSLISAAFRIHPGSPLPLGSVVQRGGVHFAIVSESATSAALVLFHPDEDEPSMEFPLDPVLNRTGNIWHVFLEGLDPGIEYGFRFDRFPNIAPDRFRFDRRLVLTDPYALACSRDRPWGNTVRKRSLRSVVVDSTFDWGLDRALNTPLANTVIYELHVRAFTKHPSSRVSNPGTFAALAEKIPYLKELGVTAVELMPVCEFDECETDRVNPFTREPLLNLWGYHPLAFFAPNAAYSVGSSGRAAVRELKEMVKSFHAAGIEVILDVVFNHTGEGNLHGPTVNFRGIDNPMYYMLYSSSGTYLDFTGCGNTLNCSHTVVREMVVDVLKHWVAEYHIDGFRFDLASALGRGHNGEVLSNPPILERIVSDPCLADVKLIAEAWDAGGLYQVGNFPAYGRWAEWNGKFRDDVRRFVKGDPGMVPSLAARLIGSPDLYQDTARQPFHSINFVTCHDGFTLSDLVSYQEKHNEANAESNRDGCSDNHSWNCGVEGHSDDLGIEKLRSRQARNLAALLMLSHGVPMLLYGDEVGRSQNGNNNAYCQDNELTWMDWARDEKQLDLFRFFKNLIAFRRRHSVLRSEQFESNPNGRQLKVDWHGTRLFQPDFSLASRTLALHLYWLGSPCAADHVFVIANSYWEDLAFELPRLEGFLWTRFLDTALDPPKEICIPGQEQAIGNQNTYVLGSRSVVVLVANPLARKT
jgi:glycogen operon protein